MERGKWRFFTGTVSTLLMVLYSRLKIIETQYRTDFKAHKPLIKSLFFKKK